MAPKRRGVGAGRVTRDRARKKLYEKINFLPFADAMFSGAAILIIIFVTNSKKTVQEVNQPQADMIVRCEGQTDKAYSVRFLKIDTQKGFVLQHQVEKDGLEANLKERLKAWPELSVRLLLQESPNNRECTEDLKHSIEKLRDTIVKDGRSGMAVPLFSTMFMDDTPSSGER